MAYVLSQRRVILGITGGIAAYKAAELARSLSKAGAQVQVVMTDAAKAFVTPLTLQALTGMPVRDSLLDPEAEAGMGHIELARWAELILIAPATADCLARLASGRGDDLLTTLVLATPAPVHLAPAMNQQMWAQASTQENLATLIERGFVIHGPESGDQACGDVGLGRMSEPDALQSAVESALAPRALEGKSITITAGPTQEAIDPVRYLSNHSSGKMGYALAEAARDLGAQVTLISGPTALTCPEGVHRIDVVSAQDMLEASLAHLPSDAFIGCAAVADYRPASPAEQKLKKGQNDLSQIQLVQNPDIIATIANSDQRPKLVIGFAAETQDALAYGQKKLAEKGLDAILVNTVGDGQAFGTDDNALHWCDSAGSVDLGSASKRVLAETLFQTLIKRTPL